MRLPLIILSDFPRYLENILHTRYRVRSLGLAKLRNCRVNIADAGNNPVEGHCSKQGIAYYDLSGVLMNASGKHALRFAVDPHYNPFTNRVIGEYLSDFLRKTYGLEQNPAYGNTWLGEF